VQSSSQDIDQSIGVIDGTDTSMVDILGLVKGMGDELGIVRYRADRSP
jgi:hypothetical protein